MSRPDGGLPSEAPSNRAEVEAAIARTSRTRSSPPFIDVCNAITCQSTTSRVRGKGALGLGSLLARCPCLAHKLSGRAGEASSQLRNTQYRKQASLSSMKGRALVV